MSIILVAKKEDKERGFLITALEEKGYSVEEATQIEEIIEKLTTFNIDFIIIDFDLIENDQEIFLKTINQQIPPPYIIVNKKPSDWEQPYIFEASSPMDILKTVERICIKEYSLFGGEINYLRHTQKYIYDLNRIVAESPHMKKVIALVKKICPFDTTVLITGETGTGKEVIAGAIHFNSPRKKRAFVKVNCASLPETLLESELFGHEKGAFTGAYKRRIGRFEQADGGSIFLDEIGDMSPALQAKILRVLQEKEFERLGGEQVIRVDVRVLAATNKDLKALIKEGQFREDLYYRLNVVHIHLLPLRERQEDILPLAQFFLKKFNTELNKQIKGFTEEAKKLLLDYHWPGNVRELENVIERAVLMAEGSLIHKEDLSIESEPFPSILKKKVKLKEVEKELIIQALEKTNWVQKKAAELLGISKRAIHYKIHKYGITHPRWRKKK